MDKITVHSCFARSILQNVGDVGVSADDLLARCRIPKGLLDYPHARISVKQFADLKRATMIAMADEMLGYTEHPVKPGCWSIMCHWVLTANTVKHALFRLVKYYSVVESNFKLALISDHRRTGLRIIFNGGNRQIEPYAHELLIFSFHRLLCWLANDTLRLTQVHLPFVRSQNEHQYKALFWGSEVVLEAPTTEFYMPVNVQNHTVQRSQQELLHFLRHPLLWMLTESYNNPSYTERVKDVLQETMQESPAFTEIAKQLEVHPKKLSRTLAAEGMGFKELKQQVQRDLATIHLQENHLTIAEIAEKLGFSETSAFTRAFKHWTGISPQTYRKYVWD